MTHDILTGSGINLPQPGPFSGEALAAAFEKINPEMAAEQRRNAMQPITAPDACQQSVLGGGMISGAAQAQADVPLTGFTMHQAQHGGWIVTRPSFGSPMAAFSTFEEAVTWLRERVAS